MTPNPEQRPTPGVVVVHGLPGSGLGSLLLSAGLVPAHRGTTVSIWAGPPVAPTGQDPMVAPPGSGQLLLSVAEAAERLAEG